MIQGATKRAGRRAKNHDWGPLLIFSLVITVSVSSFNHQCFVGAWAPPLTTSMHLRRSVIVHDSENTRSASMDAFTKPFDGAGVPRPELEPQDIPTLLMKALEQNNVPSQDAGLVSMWEFAGGNTKHIFQQNMTSFIESAHETADSFTTSFYGAAMNGLEWNMETPLNRVGGDSGCWIATQVMRTVCSDGRVRRWQWELRRNRRPPCLGCWKVETIGSSDRKGDFEAEG